MGVKKKKRGETGVRFDEWEEKAASAALVAFNRRWEERLGPGGD